MHAASRLAGHLPSCWAPPVLRGRRLPLSGRVGRSGHSIRGCRPAPRDFTPLRPASRCSFPGSGQSRPPMPHGGRTRPSHGSPSELRHVDPIRGLRGWAGPTRRLASLARLQRCRARGLAAHLPLSGRVGRSGHSIRGCRPAPRDSTPASARVTVLFPRQRAEPCTDATWRSDSPVTRDAMAPLPLSRSTFPRSGESRQPTRPEDRTCPSSGSPPVLPAWIRPVALAGGLVACGAAPRTTHRPRS